MSIVNLKYADIERFLENFYENEEFADCDEHEITNEEEIGRDMIVTSGPICRVTDLGLIFVEGVYFRYDEATDTLEPDWSLTLIYDDVTDAEFDAHKYLYFEQDGPSMSIHNFLHWRR